MFAARYLLEGLARVLDLLLEGYLWVLVAAVLLSWVNPDPYNPIVRTLRSLTDPLLIRLRRRFPFLILAGGVDLSPIAVVAAIKFLQLFVVRTILALAGRLPSS